LIEIPKPPAPRDSFLQKTQGLSRQADSGNNQGNRQDQRRLPVSS
jgi:hypothetical protein